jgi:hypothetical protein
MPTTFNAFRLPASLMLLALVPLGATHASQIVWEEFAGNDCDGAFALCTISVDGVDISPAIAKYDWTDSYVDLEGNIVPGGFTVFESNYASVEFGDYTFTDTTYLLDEGVPEIPLQAISGTWTYTPAGDDPSTRFWSVKNDGGYRLSWQVSDADFLGACNSNVNTYVLACLNAAEVITTGDMLTVDGKAISHITFFDTGVVPVPAAAWLFGSALGLLGWARIRKTS